MATPDLFGRIETELNDLMQELLANRYRVVRRLEKAGRGKESVLWKIRSATIA